MGTIIIQLGINGLLLGGLYALISIGLTLIFGIVDVVNFAHGEFLMLSMYFCYWAWAAFGMSPYLSMLFSVVIFFFLGRFIQKLLIWPIIEKPMLNQIFTTLGLSLILVNSALLFWKANSRAIRIPSLSQSIKLMDLRFSLPRLIAFIIALLIIASLFAFLKRTRMGRAIRALAQDRKAAMLVGINVDYHYQVAFGIGLACTAAAGALLIPIYNVSPSTGQLFSLIAFVVVVMGGFGYLQGSLIAGIIIGLIESYSGFFLSIHLKEAVYFMIFVLVLLIKPSGIMGGTEK